MKLRAAAASIAAISVLSLTACFPVKATFPEATADSSDEAVEEVVETVEPEQGTRANPYPIGTALEVPQWTLTVNSVNLNANEALAAENLYNEPPAEGYVYSLINVTITYTGNNPDGESPMPVIEYVTADGNTINSYDTMVIPPEQFDTLGTLYEGASTTGNFAFALPAETAGQGVLAIHPYMLSDKVFVAVQ